MVFVNLKSPLAEFKWAENNIGITVLFQVTPLTFRRLKFVRYNPNWNAFAAVRTRRLKKIYTKFSPPFCK